MPDWLALYTKPKLERQVNDVLQGKGVETYFPILYQYSSHHRRKEATPFFPCYLFAQIDPTSSEYRTLPWTPGLHCIVRFGGRPAWLPDEVVAGLRQHLAHLERSGYFEPSHQFQPGDRVRITSGPLKDLQGVFDRDVTKEGRVKILLDYLGRFTACEVEASSLAKVG
jgi:transcriptional antiterminator RfaH